MEKKAAATAIGVALGGAALVVSTQGAAQAAPAVPVTTAAATAQSSPGADKSPQWIGSAAVKAAKAVGNAAGKAYVHGKAAQGSGASSYGLLGSLWGSPPSGVSADAVASAEKVFDR